MSNTHTHQPEGNHYTDILKHYMGDIVYGASDGIITTFAIVSSITGANLTAFLIIILGFANLIADAVSMGASRYLSIRAKSETFNHQRGYLEPFIHALFTFFAFILVGAIPLIPFLVPGTHQHLFIISAIMTIISLFSIGVFRSWLGNKKWLQSSIETVLVGTIAATVAYGIGMFLARIL